MMPGQGRVQVRKGSEDELEFTNVIKKKLPQKDRKQLNAKLNREKHGLHPCSVS